MYDDPAEVEQAMEPFPEKCLAAWGRPWCWTHRVSGKVSPALGPSCVQHSLEVRFPAHVPDSEICMSNT